MNFAPNLRKYRTQSGLCRYVNVNKSDTHEAEVICISEKLSVYLIRLIFVTFEYLGLTLA